MSAHTTIVGGIEPLALGEHYTGVGVERDGEFYQVQEFVVLRHSSLTEWLQQVWERGKSLTPEPHQVEGHYYLVEFDSEPPWMKAETSESIPQRAD